MVFEVATELVCSSAARPSARGAQLTVLVGPVRVRAVEAQEVGEGAQGPVLQSPRPLGVAPVITHVVLYENPLRRAPERPRNHKSDQLQNNDLR